jgi:hypothetical protein
LVADRLIHNLYFHFVYSNARHCVVWHIEVTREGTQLFELQLIDDDAFLESHGQFQLPVLTSSEVLDVPLYAPLG